MSEKSLLDVLQEFGLSKREAETYIFLSKKGAQGVQAVSAGLKIDRVQTYRTLKNLQEKGAVEATIEAPTRFAATPFEALIESLIKGRKTKVAELEAEKDRLVSYWKSLGTRTLEYPLAKFRVLAEPRAVYEEINNIVAQSRKEFLELTTSLGVIQEDLAGIWDSIINFARKNPSVQFRILTNVSRENQETIEKTMKKISSRKLNVQWRHVDLGSRLYPQFVIKDEEETILYVTTKDEPSVLPEVHTGLWIRSEIFVSTLKESFMEMWRNAVPAEQKIEELKTGKPTELTAIIKDPKEAQTKLDQALQTAEKDIIVITSSDGINAIVKNNPFARYTKNDFQIQIMAPIDLDNLRAARELSKTCEIRHVPISYLMMLTVDNRHLFIFKTPPLDEKTTKTAFNLNDVFYTNDARYTERVTEMLNDIWKRGISITELISGPVTSQPTVQVLSSDTVSKTIDYMLKNNVNSVIVTQNQKPVGIISQKDLLERIVKPRKDPEKTLAKEIMSIPVIAIDSTDSLTDALKTMRKTGIQKIAVFREGKLVGMLT